MIINPKEIYTKSNLLSFFRLLLVIPFWILLDNFSSPEIKYFTFGLCIFAAITDILDGYLARKFNEVTELGKIIDPLADKIVVGVLIVKLYLIGIIPEYYFLMVVGRDVLIFIGGIFITKRIKKVLPSNMLGKITVINISIVILLFILRVNTTYLAFKMIYGLSIVLIFVSLIGYTIRASEFLKQKEYESI